MIEISDACIGCFVCVGVCPAGVLKVEQGKVSIVNENDCLKCLACVDACPAGAIRIERFLMIVLKNEKLFRDHEGRPAFARDDR